MSDATEPQATIIFFDGVCNLCNGFVDFVIKRDEKAIFKFCSLQSEFAVETLTTYNLDTKKLNTVVLLVDNQVFIKSNAALQISKKLSFPTNLLYYSCFWIPTFMRDMVYDLISKYRYKLFGKKETCRIPTQNEQERFI